MTAVEALRALAKSPDRVVLVDANRSLTPRMVDDRVTELATALAAASPPVRTLGVLGDNGIDWVLVDLAAQVVGIALVPLPQFFTHAQREHAVSASGMDALFAQAPADAEALGFGGPAALAGVDMPLLRRDIDPAPAWLKPTAKITFTSGTTGSPKGVRLNARQQWQVAEALAHALRGVAIERHLCLLPLPVLLENVAGIYAPLLRGAACCVPPLADVGMRGAASFDPIACLRAIERYDAHSAIVLPQMLLSLVSALASGVRVPRSLRFCAVGGAKVSPALLAQARSLGLPVYEGYGLSECASVVSLNVPGANRPGSVGRPLSHVRVRVAVDREIQVAGDANRGDEGDSAGGSVVRTGDIGRLDADGYLYVGGRLKQQIITSFGRNVSPEWPEAELVAGSWIAQAAVFGESRPALGAVLVPRGDGVTDAHLAADVRAANARLPDYARIVVWLRADAPFDAGNGLATPNGRVRRDAVRARYGERLDALYRELAGARADEVL